MEMHFRIITFLTDLLDNRFSILGFKVGLDPLIGLIPIVGDVFSLMISVYIIWIATNMGVPSHVIKQMYRNVIFDFFLGLIPWVGDISDFFYRANAKNMELLKKHKVITVTT